MSGIQNNSILQGISDTTQYTVKYLPEPATTGVGMFRDVITAAGSVSGSLVGNVARTITGGSFEDLISQQIHIQQELQTATMMSNTEKSKHEAKMAPIRNIRVN